MLHRVGTAAMLLALLAPTDGHRATLGLDDTVTSDTNGSSTAAALDPCEALRHKAYIKSTWREEKLMSRSDIGQESVIGRIVKVSSRSEVDHEHIGTFRSFDSSKQYNGGMVNVDYWGTGSAALVEYDDVRLLNPGVLIKTIEFTDCTTSSRMFGWQGETSVNVKITYYAAKNDIRQESTVALKGKLEQDTKWRTDPNNPTKEQLHPHMMMFLRPAAVGDGADEKVSRGLGMSAWGTSVHQFDSIITLGGGRESFSPLQGAFV